MQERAAKDDSKVFNLGDGGRNSWKGEDAEEHEKSVLYMQSLRHPSGDVDK